MRNEVTYIRDPPPPTPVRAKRQLRWLPLISSATAPCGSARPIGDCVCTAAMPYNRIWLMVPAFTLRLWLIGRCNDVRLQYNCSHKFMDENRTQNIHGWPTPMMYMIDLRHFVCIMYVRVQIMYFIPDVSIPSI